MTKPVPIDAVDEGMCSRVQRSRSFFNDTDKTLSSEAREDHVSEDLMSQIEPYIGDGLGRLTVSGAMSSSHEYHKAESFVSISVACNNDMDSIRQVHDIVRPQVHELINEDHQEMSLLRDTVLPPEKRLHGSAASPPIQKPAPKGLPPAKVGKPPQRGSTVKAKGVKPKPVMRR